MDDFLGSVKELQKLFTENRLQHLTTELPLIGQSLDDVLGINQKLGNAVLSLEGKTGTPLKLAAQGIVENLRTAIRGLPTTLSESSTAELNAIFDKLRSAAQNAGRIDIATPVNLASVIVASITPMTAAISRVNQAGVDLTPLNNVLTSLRSVTPSLLQLSTLFGTAIGVGATTSQFVSANPASFEQSFVSRTTWTPTIVRGMPLFSINLPNGLGPLKFAAGSTVNLSVGGDFRFDFGFNMATRSAFLLDSSRFNATASLANPAQTFGATIGGVNVTLGNPSAPNVMAITTSAGATPGALAVTLTPTVPTNDIGAIPYTSVPANLVYSGVNGRFTATLPVYLTGVPQGNITIAWTFPGRLPLQLLSSQPRQVLGPHCRIYLITSLC